MSNGATNTIIKAKLIKKIGHALRFAGKLLVTAFRPEVEVREQALVRTFTEQCVAFVDGARALLEENGSASE